jgi:hypothetical protein
MASNFKAQRLIQVNPVAFDRCCENLAMGNNLHRGFNKDEILRSLNNPGVFTGGIKAEVYESCGRLAVKVWYSQEHFVEAS